MWGWRKSQIVVHRIKINLIQYATSILAAQVPVNSKYQNAAYLKISQLHWGQRPFRYILLRYSTWIFSRYCSWWFSVFTLGSARYSWPCLYTYLFSIEDHVGNLYLIVRECLLGYVRQVDQSDFPLLKVKKNINFFFLSKI